MNGNDQVAAAIFTLALVVALAAIFFAAFVLWLARGRHGAGEIDATPQRTDSAATGYTTVDGSGNVRIVGGRQR